MNLVEYLNALPMAQTIGWALLHFLWQGAVVAMLLWFVLFLLRHHSSNTRYVACCVGMALMTALPLITLKIVSVTLAGRLPPADPSLFPDRYPTFWEGLSPALPWLTLFWLVGTLLFQARVILNWSNAQFMMRRGTHRAPIQWQRSVRQLCRRLGVTKRVNLVVSSRALVPMVVGWMRPVMLVPSFALTGLTPDQLKMVLAHELAHVRRHDYVVNFIQALFESLLFFHPAVWWLSNRIRVEREYCCDDVAVRLYRDPISYARALSSLDVLRDDVPGIVLTSTGGSLMNRIFRLVGVRSKPSPRLSGWFTPILIAMCMTAAVSAMSFGPAASPEGGEAVIAATEKSDTEAPEEEITAVKLPAKPGVEPPSELDILKQKETDMVNEMKAEGKSAEEIKKAITKLHAKFEEKKKLELKYKKVEEKAAKLADKYKAKGRSQEEIETAIGQLYMMSGLKPPPRPSESGKAMLEKKAQMLEEQMIKEGKPKEEIKKAVEKLYKEYQAYQQKEMEVKKKAEELAKKMKADGKSDQEIKAAMTEVFKKNGIKIKVLDKEMEFEKAKDELIKKMTAEGKSKEEITKALIKLEKKQGVKKKKAF